MTTVRTQGRIAGVTYLGVVLTGIFTLAYAPGRLIFSGDPAATSAAISANPGLFDAANYASLAMSAFFLALPFALSRFLSPYGANASRVMIVFVAASIPLTLAAAAQNFELAHLVRAGGASAEAVAAKLSAHNRWMDYASIFWGLWLAPLGWLILKSGAIPRVLGLLLFAGCAGYLANFFGPALYQGYEDLSFPGWISKAGSIGEIGTCLWLLVMGARGSSPI
ncbi:MAG: DUF4386 domain-containing protein [Pseudomonadota bacterium]